MNCSEFAVGEEMRAQSRERIQLGNLKFSIVNSANSLQISTLKKVGKSRKQNICDFYDFEHSIIFISPSIKSKCFNNLILTYDFQHYILYIYIYILRIYIYTVYSAVYIRILYIYIYILRIPPTYTIYILLISYIYT